MMATIWEPAVHRVSQHEWRAVLERVEALEEGSVRRRILCDHRHRHRDTALRCAREWALDELRIPSQSPVHDVGWSTCPVCRRTWIVTAADDCMLPACGCYGSDTSRYNPLRPCEACGLAHAMDCPKLKGD